MHELQSRESPGPEGEQKEQKSFHSPSGARATRVRDLHIEFCACSVFFFALFLQIFEQKRVCLPSSQVDFVLKFSQKG